MILEWIRFGIVALLFLTGIVMLYVSILGTFRFDFALNRIHAAGMNDSIVLALFLLACAVWSGFTSTSFKFAVLLMLQWFTSPMTSHVLVKMEYMTDESLSDHCELDNLNKSNEVPDK